eukprot:3361833-Pleurochrysis_carterae.AAC.1
MLATLSPIVGKPLAQAAGIRVEGGEVAEKPLKRALELLQLEWQTLVGEGAQAEDDDASENTAGVLLEEAWLAGDPADAASMLRLASLRTIGVVTGDDAAQDAASVARFLCAAAGGGESADAIQAALAERWQRGSASGRLTGVAEGPGQATRRAVEAGEACVAALRAALEALGALGAAEVLKGARALRSELGVPVSAAARGALAARALQARAEADALRPSPPQPANRRLTRSSPARGGTAQEASEGAAATTSPRGALIRRLRAQLQEAEQAAAATPSSSRSHADLRRHGLRGAACGDAEARGGGGARRRAGADPAQAGRARGRRLPGAAAGERGGRAGGASRARAGRAAGRRGKPDEHPGEGRRTPGRADPARGGGLQTGDASSSHGLAQDGGARRSRRSAAGRRATTGRPATGRKRPGA